MKRKVDVVDLVAHLVDDAQRRERQVSAGVHAGLVALRDADHAEGETVHLHVLTYKSCRVVLVELFGLVLVEYDDLALLAVVHVVDKASVEHLYLVDAGMHGRDTVDLGAEVVLASC